MMHMKAVAWTVVAGLAISACQSPTDPSDSLEVDDFVTAVVSPDPTNAEASTGVTYRVVRGNNQPDDVLEFDWKTSFSVAVTITDAANDEDADLTFPVEITSATVKVEQASAGIITPPTGGEVEHFTSVITQSSGSSFGAADETISMSFDVWYDLPNLRKEALVTVTLAMRDDEEATFSKIVKVRVNP